MLLGLDGNDGHLLLLKWTRIWFPTSKSGSSQFPGTPAPGNLLPSFSLLALILMCTCWPPTHTLIIKKTNYIGPSFIEMTLVWFSTWLSHPPISQYLKASWVLMKDGFWSQGMMAAEWIENGYMYSLAKREGSQWQSLAFSLSCLCTLAVWCAAPREGSSPLN